jgi:hypothetical protein
MHANAQSAENGISPKQLQAAVTQFGVFHDRLQLALYRPLWSPIQVGVNDLVVDRTA